MGDIREEQGQPQRPLDERDLADRNPIEVLRAMLAISPEEAEQVRKDAAEATEPDRREHDRATAWFADYARLPKDEAIAKAAAENRPYRVFHPGDAITLDYRLNRLNVHLDAHGNLVELRPG